MLLRNVTGPLPECAVIADGQFLIAFDAPRSDCIQVSSMLVDVIAALVAVDLPACRAPRLHFRRPPSLPRWRVGLHDRRCRLCLPVRQLCRRRHTLLGLRIMMSIPLRCWLPSGPVSPNSGGSCSCVRERSSGESGGSHCMASRCRPWVGEASADRGTRSRWCMKSLGIIFQNKSAHSKSCALTVRHLNDVPERR